MAAAKSERVLNLLIALLTTKRFLTKHELREMVEGYRESGSFDRTFERDKKELRDLGIEIETGSNDRDLNEEDGYRINRGTFELPPVEFTAEELVAIGLAAHTWQTSVSAQATTDALLRLSAAGAAPDLAHLPPIRAQIPVAEPSFDVIYEALFQRRAITFTYDGRTRRLEPWRLYQRRGQWLVIGRDLDRDATRRFKLNRIEGEVEAVGSAGAYDVPADVDTQIEPPTTVSAVVALRDAPELTAGAAPAEWDGPLPEGFTAHEVSHVTDAMLVAEICAAGPEAVVLAPESIRDAVVARLETLSRSAW